MITDLVHVLLALAVLFIPMGLQWLLLVVLHARPGRRTLKRP